MGELFSSHKLLLQLQPRSYSVQKKTTVLPPTTAAAAVVWWSIIIAARKRRKTTRRERGKGGEQKFLLSLFRIKPILLKEMPEPRRQSFLRRSSKSANVSMEELQEQLQRSSLKKERKQSADSDRHVSFSKLEIREFLIMLGDNPSCEGAPLCISDECQSERVVDVNEFEANRKSRRHRKQLALSATKRSRL